MSAKTLVGFAVVGAGAYVGYRELFRPWQAQRQAEKEARELSTRTGISYADAMTAVGTKACQAVAGFYKVPPDKSATACALASKLATLATIAGTKLTIKAVGAAGHALGKTYQNAMNSKLTPSNALLKASLLPVISTKKTIAVAKKLKFWGLEGLHC